MREAHYWSVLRSGEIVVESSSCNTDEHGGNSSQNELALMRLGRRSRPAQARGSRSTGFLGGTIGIAFGHAVTHVLLDSVLRERIAKTVLRQRRHSLYRLSHILRRQGHQHLIVEYAAVAPLGEAGDR